MCRTIAARNRKGGFFTSSFSAGRTFEGENAMALRSPEVDERELLRLYIAEASAEAFARIVERYAGLVYATAFRRVGDEALAEDVTQAVFLVLSQRARQITTTSALAGWLCQTATYAAMNAMRMERRRLRHERRAGQYRAECAMNSAQLFHADLWPMLAQAMDGLGVKERDAVLLRFFEGRTVSEIAEQLRIDPQTAAKRVERGVGKLRDYFRRRRIEFGDFTLAAILGSDWLHQGTTAVRQAVIKNIGTASPASAALAAATVGAMSMQAVKAAVLLISLLTLAMCATVLPITRGGPPSAPSVAPLAAPSPAPQPPALGRLHLVFDQRSPLSSFDRLSSREPFKNLMLLTPGGITMFPKQSAYNLQAESFEALVPSNYQPDGSFGLFVWISPGDAILPAGWGQVLQRHKLIWICPNNAGNDRFIFVQAGLALDAAYNMSLRYRIDPQRVYVSGFCGGGGVASHLIRGFAGVFSGAFCISGYAFYSSSKDETGQAICTMGVPFDSTVSLDRLKQELRLVIMDGEGDPSTDAGNALRNADAFRLDGFQRVHGWIVPGLRHNVPDANWFEKGILALEAPPQPPGATGPTTRPDPLPDQVAQAERLLASAEQLLESRVGSDKRARKVATKFLKQAIDDYPTTPAAQRAREVLQSLNPATPVPK
jgi:RNA polymerase sigma factor (sigma-70 family)